MAKQTSIDIRDQIIKLAKEGKSLREIGAIVNRKHSTIQYIITKFKKTEKIEDLPRSGRPQRLTVNEKRYIARKVRSNPRESAVKIAQDVAECHGASISASTIRRALHENGLHGRRPRKKPFISRKNQALRLSYAKTYINHDLTFWNNVVFSDESKFQIFGQNPSKIWRSRGQELSEQNICNTVKYGGGSVMVWGCIAASGVGNLVFIENIMNKTDYLNILRANLHQSVEKLGLGSTWIFQQDNDPKHTAKNVKEWLLYRVPKQLPHPPQSPDLNPIEHLWEHLDRKIRQRTITSKESLKIALMEEWEQISSDVTKNLVNSMPRRLTAVKKAKGKHTKY